MKITADRIAFAGFRAFSLLTCLVLLAAVSGAGCNSASTSVVAPTAQKCQISVTGFTRTFGAAGGSGAVAVAAARECSWTATSGTSWISVPSAAQGTGDGKFTFSVAPNTAPRGRSGGVTVNNQQITVSQEAAPCLFTVSPPSQAVPAAGGTFSLSLSATEGCAWTAASQAAWIDVASASGTGSGSFSFIVAANTGAARTGTVLAAGQTVTITQAAQAATPPPGCEYAIAPESLSFAAAGGDASLRVATTAGCAWTATSGASWLALSPASGSVTGTIDVTADANPLATPRATTIDVAGRIVAVSQEGTVVPTPVRLTGDVSALRGDCPSLRFRVDGVTIVTSAATIFVDTTCSRLRNGAGVTVEGLSSPDGVVVATRVKGN